MRDLSTVVVVGAGAAGHAAAATLRREGYAGSVVVVHGEPGAPYNRTLVDKAILQGLLTLEQAALPAVADDVELVPARATALDASAAAVTLSDGRRIPCAALVVATGSAPRRHDLVRAGERRVVHVHTAADAVRLRGLLEDDGVTRATVLGAGFVGVEVADALAGAGLHVDLVARSTLPLVGALGESVARRVAGLLQGHVSMHLGRRVERVAPGRGGVTIALDDGTRLRSHLVVVAHGTMPATAWTGTDDGILVDDRLRAAGGPRVYAAGGAAVHETTFGVRFRIDHWDAGAAQGTHAARTVLHDLAGAPDPGPYVATTGFTLRMRGTTVAASGTVPPGAVALQQETDDPDAVLTSFHRPDGALVGAAGIRAARALLALRANIHRP